MGTSNSTLLTLSGIDFSDYASRGVSTTLGLESTGSLRRDINGDLHDCTLPQFYKRTVQIQCKDVEVPNFVGIKRGSVVEVTLVPGLGLDTVNTDGSTTAITLSMMVDVWQVNEDSEWEVLKNWSLSLREI